MPLDEFALIRHFFTRDATQPSVMASIGDDCAVLSVPADQQLVVSIDTLVEGRHFPAEAAPYDIGTRAMCTAISDLAAMGATPLWFTLALTLPEVNSEWLHAFSKGMFAIASRYSMDLVGGDTTRGPLTISVQVHGCVSPLNVLRRDAACEGDHVFVSGCLGDGAAALAAIQQRITPSSEAAAYLHSRFYAPPPRIELGRQLLPFSSSAIDISDGLLADAQHIANASRVGIDIQLDQLPIHPLVAPYTSDCLEWALVGGDDYQLLFTINQQKMPAFEQFITEQSIAVTPIGRVVTAHRGVNCYHKGVPYDMPSHQRGYQHFTA